LTAKDLQNVIQWLCFLAQNAAKKRTSGKHKPQDNGERVEVAPIPITSDNVILGNDPSEIVLVLRMYDFDLGFQLDAQNVAYLKNGFAQIEQMLSVAPKRRQ
jgi:hypothetical protein